MDVDHGATILSKLGILQSTLKSPHRTHRLGRNHSLNEAGEDSSSSENCLFQNERITITRAQIFRHRRNERDDNASKPTSLNWTCLLCTFSLIFVSIIWAEFLRFKILNVSGYAERSFTTLKFYMICLPSYLTATILADSLFARLSSITIYFAFLILSSQLLISFFIIQNLPTTACLIFIATIASVAQRGFLLLSKFAQNPRRVIFYLCLIFALSELTSSALLAFTTKESSNVKDAEKTIPFVDHHSVFKREIFGADNTTAINWVLSNYHKFAINNSTTFDQNFSGNITNTNETKTYNASITTETTPTTTDVKNRIFKTKTEENKIMRKEAERRRKEKEKMEPEKVLEKMTTVGPIPLNGTDAVSTNLSNNTYIVQANNSNFVNLATASGQNTTNSAELITVPSTINETFDAETENKFIRNTVERESSTSSRPILYPVRKNSVLRISSEGMGILSPNTSQRKTDAQISNFKNGKDSDENEVKIEHLLPLVLLLFGALIAPIAIWFCVYCVGSRERLPVVRRENSDKVQFEVYTTEEFEPILCRMLSFLIWFIHFGLESLILNKLYICFDTPKFVDVLFALSVSYWAASAASAVFFIFCTHYSSGVKSIHLSYAISILSCLYFNFNTNVTFGDALLQFFSLGLFTNCLPWLVSTWLNDLTKPDPFTFSSRFVIAAISGKTFGAYLLYYFESDSNSNLSQDWNSCISKTSAKIHYLAIVLLGIGYGLFVVLSYTGKRANRQRQIIQLSEEINGRHVRYSDRRKRRKKRKNNNQYTALINEEIPCDRKDDIDRDDGDSSRSYGENDTTDDEMSDVEASIVVTK